VSYPAHLSYKNTLVLTRTKTL